MWAGGRWHYLAAVLDLHTRRVAGWSMSDRPDADLAVKEVEMAYQQQGSPFGVLFHPDQGRANMAVRYVGNGCGAIA